MQETRVRSLGWENPLEKEMATYTSILAWEIPLTEEPGGLQTVGSQRVRCDLATKQQQTSFARACLQWVWEWKEIWRHGPYHWPRAVPGTKKPHGKYVSEFAIKFRTYFPLLMACLICLYVRGRLCSLHPRVCRLHCYLLPPSVNSTLYFVKTCPCISNIPGPSLPHVLSFVFSHLSNAKNSSVLSDPV